MQTAGNKEIPITVELEDMMSYSSIGLIVSIVLLVILLVYVLLRIIIKQRKQKPEEITYVPNAKKLEHIKNKYRNMLTNIEQKRSAEKISERIAYQELSKVIRHFVYDATGIKVQNYTLEEIGRVNIPNLYYLIAECYVPEFSGDDVGNVYDSINKARMVIEGWN